MSRDIKESLKKSLLSQLKTGDTLPKIVPKESKQPKVQPKKKKRVGRPSITHQQTKINTLLTKLNLTRKDLFQAIAQKYPDEPVSADAISRIVSGERLHYSTYTLLRICGALKVSPNDILDWEEEVQ